MELLLLAVGGLFSGVIIGISVAFVFTKQSRVPKILFYGDDNIIMEIELMFSTPISTEEVVAIGTVMFILVIPVILHALSYVPVYGIGDYVSSLNLVCWGPPRQCWPVKH
jgi:hypothetical protein